MADSVYYYNGATTTPHSTYPITSPLVTDIPLATMILHGIRVRMPPGPCGNLGFAFYDADAQIVPYSLVASYVVGDDEIWNFDYESQVGVQLMLWTYNAGTYDHELLYEINYTPIAAALASVTPTLPGVQIASEYLLPQDNVFQARGESVAE
jgi:hypothetical protein